MQVEIKTKPSDMHDLYVALDNSRKKTVELDRKLLVSVLSDNAAMRNALRGQLTGPGAE